jgi:hypothetical protein
MAKSLTVNAAVELNRLSRPVAGEMRTRKIGMPERLKLEVFLVGGQGLEPRTSCV